VKVSLTKQADDPAFMHIDAEEMKRVMTDPVYFINNYCWTFDPRTPPYHFPFKLYPYQVDYIRELCKSIDTGENIMTEKSRDMGATWVALGVMLWYWLFVPGSQFLLGSRKEDLVDNFTIESLFGKLDYLFQRQPFHPAGFEGNKHRGKLKMMNPMNGNLFTGESANANFARQGRYKAIFIDEFAFWEDPEGAWSSSGESTRCIIATTTPPKRPNFAKALRNSGLVHVVTLHWRLHPMKGEDWYERQKLRKTSEEIARELDINWEGSITGRYYPEIDHVRIGKFPYMPNWPLWVSHDPGFADPHAITWWQVNPENGRYRLIMAFEKQRREIAWFAPFFGFPIDSQFTYTSEELDLIRITSEWKKATHFGDPYGNSQHGASGESVYNVLASKFQIIVNVNNKAEDHDSRRTALALILSNCDVDDNPHNLYFIECMRNARVPERTPGSQSTTENTKPVHDWTSHLRSSAEYFAVNVDWDPRAQEPSLRTFNSVMAQIQSKKRGSTQFRVGR